MSPEQQKQRAASLRAVVAFIHDALPDIDKLVRSSEDASRRLSENSSDSLLVFGAGGLLHGFYNELEKLFEIIATEIDGFEPRGEDWHARLSSQMFLGIPTLRPPIFPKEMLARLREFRSFRHLYRHLYVLDLDPNKVLPLLKALPKFWEEANCHFAALVSRLIAIADALEELG